MKTLTPLFFVFLLCFCNKEEITTEPSKDKYAELFIEKQTAWKGKLSKIEIFEDGEFKNSRQFFYDKNLEPIAMVEKDNYKLDSIIFSRDTLVHEVSFARSEYIKFNKIEDFRSDISNAETYFLENINGTLLKSMLPYESGNGSVYNNCIDESGSKYVQNQLVGLDFGIFAEIDTIYPVSRYTLNGSFSRKEVEVNYNIENNSLGLFYDYLNFKYDFFPYALFGIKLANKKMIANIKNTDTGAKEAAYVYEHDENGRLKTVRIDYPSGLYNHLTIFSYY
jgi:hypothetical protein